MTYILSIKFNIFSFDSSTFFIKRERKEENEVIYADITSNKE